MVSESEQVAMEVTWRDETSEHERWFSYDDNFCTPWMSTKLLPSSATNISVRFYIRCTEEETVCGYLTDARGKPEEATDKEEAEDEPTRQLSQGQVFKWEPVLKAHEHAMGEEKKKLQPPEVIELRTNAGKFVESSRGVSNSIDAVFTLAGCGLDCHLKSAWNAAGEPRSWEVCDEESGRPEPAETLPVLRAADATPSPPPELGNKASAYVHATNRFIAALKALQQVRRDGMEQLDEIDGGFTMQWWTVNIMNTISFGCDTTSAATVIPCPPVSIATGFSSALLTITQWTIDSLGEARKNRRLRELLYWMLWNCVAVQELERKWQAARKAAEDDLVLSEAIDSGIMGDHYEIIRTIAGNTFCITFDIVSTSTSVCNSTARCPIRVPYVLSWFGAFGCFVVAANGWFTTKQVQSTVREMALKLQAASEIADKHLEKFMEETESNRSVRPSSEGSSAFEGAINERGA